MGAGDFPLEIGRKLRPQRPSANVVQLSHLRKLRGSEQVAAVCYRVHRDHIEFLLVQTDGGRWTFPKGSVESGLTNAQSAALEAFEEAGVHGRIEEACFARYVRRKGARSIGVEVVVNAHLCEVSWLDKPQEADRNPTWFNVEKAKRRLREGRNHEDGGEHCRVLEMAVLRIARWHPQITGCAVDDRGYTIAADKSKKRRS
jgi:8-oxo-dGTP pyrophosphatase MutT (NUDIX family)